MFANEMPSTDCVRSCADVCWWYKNHWCRLYCIAEWLGSTLQMVSIMSGNWSLMFPNASIQCYFNQAHHKGPYYLNGTLADTVSSHCQAATLHGILFDDQLKFHDHTTQVTNKSNRALGMIKKSFEYLMIMLTQLFSIFIKPMLPGVQ